MGYSCAEQSRLLKLDVCFDKLGRRVPLVVRAGTIIILVIK